MAKTSRDKSSAVQVPAAETPKKTARAKAAQVAVADAATDKPARKAAARKSAAKPEAITAATGAELSPAELSASLNPSETDRVVPTDAPAEEPQAEPQSAAIAAVAASLSAPTMAPATPPTPAAPLEGLRAGTAARAWPGEGRVRAVIDALKPSVDGGRFDAKCIAGEAVDIQVHAFTDGHDRLRVFMHWRAEDEATPREVEMALDVNDEWHAHFLPPAPGRYLVGAVAWVDALHSWRHELMRRVDAADIRIAAQVGAELLDGAAVRAQDAGASDDAGQLKAWSQRLREAAPAAEPETLKALALDAGLAALADRHPDRSFATVFPERPLWADRPKARFSTWYELFPRSASPDADRHGTFADVEARLPYVAEMGFDVLYFPPVHPVGREKRKGRNNTLTPEEHDVGSPWAIGAAEGGHKSLLPELGTPEDFRRLVAKAREMGIEVAMDIALQCAPDHPYVKEHPQWFRWRPDGTVQYAENPPKKYQDIYPFNFECDDWPALWRELKSIFDHWIGEGVKIFRVDNPHTKSFAFWEWCIAEIRREHPDVLFLAEAFTRPKVMHRLAKLGYSQSYTYFTWRHTKEELTTYFTELSQGEGYAYFRPNVWPNTPDILNEQLHGAPRSVFAQRLVLAATLSSSYGIYGPAYELMENRPAKPGSEEYLDSEKYQRRLWDLDRPDSLRWFIGQVNAIRRAHPALHDNRSLRFMPTDNEQLIAYTKRSADGRDTLLVVVNLDAHQTQAGTVDVNLEALDLKPDTDYVVHDLLEDQRHTWRNGRNFVMLDPHHCPAHVFVIERGTRSERDFDGFQG